jgi:hypothetical protein
MKILNRFKSAKGILTRFSLIICLGFCLNSNSFSNPIVPPPMITEIYFGTGGWSIELFIQEYLAVNNLDNMRMKGLYDTAQFVPGIEFVPGEPFFVTTADFQTPFYINQAGDYLSLEELYDGEWRPIDYLGLAFGDIPEPYYSEVCAPVGEESIAWQSFEYTDSEPDFWTVKELPNTIGSSPYQVSKRASFSGYVKDKNDDPIADVKLYYCSAQYHYETTPTVPEIFTDSNGYYLTDNMFCKKYNIRFLFEGGQIGDTTICVEPDAANYFEFKLDTLLTGIGEYRPAKINYSIINIPNPLSSQTTFIIESSGYRQNQKGVIKIYSPEGFIVDILPVEISAEKQELAYNLADKSQPAGIYYYSFEIGREKKASGKMVISR